MEYAVPLALAFFAAFAIIFIVNKIGKLSLDDVLFSQSELHNLLKHFIVVEEKKQDSQLQRYLNKNSIKVMTVDDKAYWIANNIFYTADVVDDMPDFNSATQVDTINMSQKELDKIMFILDNLRRGIEDDSGSTRD